MITLYTIGFTKKTAEQFFELLRKHGVKRIVDVRLNNTSQLASFAKMPDLQYFLDKICAIGYEAVPDFAPTKELLSDYQHKKIDWLGYERVFRQLLEKRRVADKYKAEQFDGCCLLCSEDTPEHCHRRLVAEYLRQNSAEEVKILHLK